MCLVCHPSLYLLSRLSLNQKLQVSPAPENEIIPPVLHLCHCTFPLSRGWMLLFLFAVFFLFFSQGLMCRATFAQVLSQCMRVTRSERAGVGRVKNECHFECTNAAVRELCVIEGGGGRPENVDLTPVPQLFSSPIQRSLILRDSALSKHIRVMTHIPGTTCSAEAHFSMLRDMLRGQ